MKKTSSASVRFIFATIFLDALGIGVLIPVFLDVIRRFGHDPSFVLVSFLVSWPTQVMRFQTKAG